MEREKLELGKYYLRAIIQNDYDQDLDDNDGLDVSIIKGYYRVIETKVNGIPDEEDGAGDFRSIFKRNSDRKFFEVTYTGWDLEYNFERDFPDCAIEVFPEQQTITVYK